MRRPTEPADPVRAQANADVLAGLPCPDPTCTARVVEVEPPPPVENALHPVLARRVVHADGCAIAGPASRSRT